MSDIKTVWAQAAEIAKKNSLSPNLFRALDRTLALAYEDGVFVVGIDTADGLLISTINTGENQLQVERALRQATQNGSLKFRLIEGTTEADWQRAKSRDVAAAAQRVEVLEKKKVLDAGAIASWDQLNDQMSRLWANFEYRTMSSGKGRFLQAAFDTIEAAIDNLGEPNEQTERSFTRVLERVGSMTGSDPAILSYLYHERRKSRG